MRKKISVIGDGVEIAQELSRIAEIGADVRGADVVVLAGGGDLAEIARSAPAAAVIVAGDDLEGRCSAVYEGTLFPRARVIGVTDAQVSAAAESVVLERDDEHEVVAMSDDSFGARSVRLGRGGIRELL